MEKEYYSINDIVEELQYSRSYIYRLYNLNKVEFKKYSKTIKGSLHLSLEGFELIKEKLKINDDENEKEIDYQQELIEQLREENLFLRSQLQDQTEIVKREQQLRMTESQNILLLQERFEEVDEKLNNWREKNKTVEFEKKSFFSKVFGR